MDGNDEEISTVSRRHCHPWVEIIVPVISIPIGINHFCWCFVSPWILQKYVKTDDAWSYLNLLTKAWCIYLGDPDSVLENFTQVFLEPDLWWFVLQCNTDTIKVEPNSEDEAHRSHDETKVDTEPDHSQDFTLVGVKCEIEVGLFQKL